MKWTFRDESFKPNHIFYDNNCNLSKIVRDDPYFANIGLSVNVFHFTCKHTINDIFCQTHCNPHAFPELLNPEGGWYFNSSIAEQTNVWLGGYHSICREMKVDKYRFFLDEMVMRKNRLTRQAMEKGGLIPSTRPATT